VAGDGIGGERANRWRVRESVAGERSTGRKERQWQEMVWEREEEKKAI
jgi:hypothetical protein